MSQIIAVYNFKGGVGKTTSALNLARNWSRTFRVLLIDGDPQANLTQALGIDPTPEQELTYLCKESLHNYDLNFEPCKINRYLSIIPCTIQLNEIESNPQFITFGDEIIRKILEVVKRDYDFVIVDCPSHFGILVKAMIANSNSLLIPSTADSFSLSGIETLLDYVYSHDSGKKINLLGIFFNMFLAQTKYHTNMMQMAKDHYGHLILDQTIRRTIKMNEATDQGRSLNYLDPTTKGANDIIELSEELMQRIDSYRIEKFMSNKLETAVA